MEQFLRLHDVLARRGYLQQVAPPEGANRRHRNRHGVATSRSRNSSIGLIAIDAATPTSNLTMFENLAQDCFKEHSITASCPPGLRAGRKVIGNERPVPGHRSNAQLSAKSKQPLQHPAGCQIWHMQTESADIGFTQRDALHAPTSRRPLAQGLVGLACRSRLSLQKPFSI